MRGKQESAHSLGESAQLAIGDAELSQLLKVVHGLSPREAEAGSLESAQAPQRKKGGIKESPLGLPLFVGEFHLTIDAKGRLMIPKALRAPFKELGAVVTANPDGGLWIFSRAESIRIMRELRAAASLSNEAINLKTYFANRSHICLADRQGRISLPPEFRERILGGSPNTSIKAILNGCGNLIEVWSVEGWNKHVTSLSAAITSAPRQDTAADQNPQA